MIGAMSARRVLLAAGVVAVLVAGVVALIVTFTRHGRPAPSAALRVWTQRSSADLDAMYADAPAARSGGQAACNRLYGDAMVVLADLPSPDHALNRLVNDAAES